MAKHQRNIHAETHAEPPKIEPQAAPASEQGMDDIGTKIATVAAVGVAAALIEAELIPGILLGAAAVFAPSVFPKLGGGLRPLIKSAVRAGYSLAGKTRETFAEANEQFQDIVAEVKAETQSPVRPAESRAASEAAASGEVV